MSIFYSSIIIVLLKVVSILLMFTSAPSEFSREIVTKERVTIR